MGKTERLELRLDEEIVNRIDTWMNETDPARSRSDAILQLVDIGLGVVTGKSIHLTDGDKLNFMMLRDIRNLLNGQEAEINVDLFTESIFGGHYWAPTWETHFFHRETDRPEDVDLVVDTLEMWEFIEEGIEKLTPDEIERLKSANHGSLPKFHGFDGNNETALMKICILLVETMGRFNRFKQRDFNSHMQKVQTYRQMISRFRAIRPTLTRDRRLGVDHIIALLGHTQVE